MLFDVANVLCLQFAGGMGPRIKHKMRPRFVTKPGRNPEY